MHVAYLTVVILAAVANLYAGISDFRRPDWIVANIKRLEIEERWLPALGLPKILGGIGLLVGLLIPPIGIAAAIGLVLFFVAAIVTAMRARWYEHLPYPSLWLSLAVASLVLFLHAK
jgi:DoxX-like family